MEGSQTIPTFKEFKNALMRQGYVRYVPKNKCEQ
jgi:hypothetical protein